MERTRFKRRDYANTRLSTEKGPNNSGRLPLRAHRATVIPGLIPQEFSPPVRHVEPHKTSADKDESVLSFNIELPTLRRPPDSGDIPKRGLKWALIIITGIIFFMIGYTSLWRITSKSLHFSSAIGSVERVKWLTIIN